MVCLGILTEQYLVFRDLFIVLIFNTGSLSTMHKVPQTLDTLSILICFADTHHRAFISSQNIVWISTVEKFTKN